jgi:hypothetical protein
MSEQGIGTVLGRRINISGSVGDSVIVTGDSNIAVVAGEVVGRNVSTDDKKLPVISSEEAFDRIGVAARVILEQIKLNIEQARTESKKFFNLTLIYAGIGFSIVLFGIVLLFFGATSAGIVTTIASIIPETTAALFFKKDKELRETIDNDNQHLREFQQILTMIDVAKTMKDHIEKDKMKQRIIFKVLGIEPSL